MITNDEMIELKNLVSSKKIREFRSDMKKAYKVTLCGLFGDIIKYGQYRNGRFYGIAMDLAYNPLSYTQIVPEGRLEDTLYAFYLFNDHYFYNDDINDSKYLDSVLDFFRSYLSNYEKKKRRLYLVKDIQKIYDIKKFHLVHGVKVKDHHWMDINFSHPITFTIPEFFNYADVINIWNEFISVYFKLLAENDDKETRKLQFRLSTSSRQLVIASITFLESYLYYYFYNLKNDNTLAVSHSVKKVIEQDEYLQDKQIIKQIIFKLHQHIKNDEAVKQLFKKIKENIKLRDRFIHNSAFIDKTNQLSQLEPLMALETDEIIDIAQSCIDFILRVEELLPEEEKILFWWDAFETPDFKKKKYISPLNIKEN
ncbi:hypothetical protein [Bacillus altitudinis]|uniref:hypothetical protein n=1 Tax=Bacillus altitudinis TaxID=293387 RepID=UPI00227E3979|nr:hypothetical protein [Bacillus altitudinis]MCY7449237.1 hypothetical protein [Bacillus altitudinis]MCY7453753.1 hypothetical protein [Bacillus altitudinis]MCY7530696.1 hypothetical protein [Bacillus altitudinis]